MIPGKSIPPFVAYIMSVALDKGLSIVTIPLVAAYLSPAEYGRLDVAASLVEFVGLLLTFGLADTLIRFAGDKGQSTVADDGASHLLGAGLLLALLAVGFVQIAAPVLAQILAIQVDMWALRVALAAAAVGALVEMPLMWLRVRRRGDLFLAFIAARSSVQLVLTVMVLRAGWGVEGLLVANGLAIIGLAVALATFQALATGVHLSAGTFRRIGSYGVPLVAAALAMFALGGCSRWFMAGRLPDGDIAAFGLGFKVALIVPLILQPFALWWNPQRIGALSEPSGIERSLRAWGLGFGVLTAGATAVALGGPVLIHLVLPASYAPAAVYVPLMVVICFMNELSTLCNVGAYARSTGTSVLGINICGAAAGVCGYALLTPMFGATGVIAAMIIGHSLRFVSFVAIGRQLAPIPYPVVPAALSLAFAAAGVWFAPLPIHVGARIAWSIAVMAVVAATLVKFRLVRMPDSPLQLWPRTWADAGQR